ncbi:MAG: CoA transferase subunit A [Bacteroidales bacterium]|jgi:acetate CoA/acetoacetate CoA-transferase alpha subunit|nr:CoA transferase subunit A [Bacteroidales bacterium]
MDKFITAKDAVEKIQDGMTIMVGGFLAVGTPISLIDALVEKGVKDLTLICNDTAYPNIGVGKLISNRMVKKLIVSHIGTNEDTINQMNAGELDVEFSPQGTLAERVRAGGAGLGGVLTPTGLGTVVGEGKDIVVVDGKEYLLEKPLKADVALIGANICDEVGNLVYKGTSQNFNPLMATAANVVIVEPQEIVKTGAIEHENVKTPGIFVDYIIKK